MDGQNAPPVSSQALTKNRLFLIGAAVLIVLVIGAVFVFGGKKGAPGPSVQNPPGGETPQNPNALPTVPGGTREIIQQEIKAPDMGATEVPENVAVPQADTQTGVSKLRTYKMEGVGGKYVPDTIVVNELDTVSLAFTAVDRDYDIYLADFAVFLAVKKGESATIQFQAYNYGQYKFYCKDSCGSEVSGTLIVNKREE